MCIRDSATVAGGPARLRAGCAEVLRSVRAAGGAPARSDLAQSRHAARGARDGLRRCAHELRTAQLLPGLSGAIGPVRSHPTHGPVSYTHLRAHETPEHLVCRLLLE